MLVIERQEQAPNFQDEEGNLFLVQCYACCPEGRENYLPAIATGQCAWCGWSRATASPVAIVGGASDNGKRGDHGRDTTY